MNFLDIYNLLAQGEITHDQAATILGMTPKNLKFRITKWGHKLPLLLATLDKIKADTITREEASAALNVVPRQVNKLMESWKVTRPLKTYHVSKAATSIKWEIHKKYAIDFISGSMELLEAAENAGISDRQMRREISKLLKKHYEMPFKDLNQISLNRRKRLADEIETAEGLELAKQSVLKSIADGKLSIREEALNRVLSKRSNQAKKINTDRRNDAR
jgi:hypothetical protein